MKITMQRLAITGCVFMIALGAYSAIFSYYATISPLQETQNMLDRIQATSDPQLIVTDLRTIKIILPKEGNPAWMFSSDSTDFGLMQKNLDTMIQNLGDSVFAPKYNDLNNQLSIVHFQAFTIESNILEAIPYMSVNASFVIAMLLCIHGSLGLMETLSRKIK